MTPDQVCDSYSRRGVSLSISLLDDEVVLIEGDRVSLEFLGELIKSQSLFDKDCGFSIEPRGAGSVFFQEGSPLGVYIHVKHSGRQEK